MTGPATAAEPALPPLGVGSPTATRGSWRPPSAGPTGAVSRRAGPRCTRSSPSASTTISNAKPARYRTNSIAADYTVVGMDACSGSAQIDEFDPVRHLAHRVLLL